MRVAEAVTGLIGVAVTVIALSSEVTFSVKSNVLASVAQPIGAGPVYVNFALSDSPVYASRVALVGVIVIDGTATATVKSALSVLPFSSVK